MAISNSDGSIILTTEVDTSGITDFFGDTESTVKGLKKTTTQLKTETKEYGKQAETSGKKANNAFTGLKSTLTTVASKLALVFSVTKLIQFSQESANIATQTEASVARVFDIYGSASGVVGDFIDANASALGLAKSSAAEFASVYGNLFSVWADQTTNAKLTNKYLAMTAVVASKTGRTMEDVQERIRSGLLGNTEAVEDLGIFVNVKTIEMTKAFQRIADGRSWDALSASEQSQVRTLAILEQATNKYGNEVATTTALTRANFNAAYQDFQATWGQVVNQVLIPILQVLTQILQTATVGLQNLFGLSKKILGDTEKIDDTTEKITDNQDDLNDKLKDTNKELQKTLAGFDDIQKLSSSTSETDVNSLVPPTGDLDNVFGFNNLVSEISQTAAEIMAIAATTLVAIGLLLCASGHIGWGIGFIIAGAADFAVTMAVLNDDAIEQQIKDSMTGTFVLVGIAAIMIGILLCCAGNWGLGVGLIAVGALDVAIPITLNWDAVSEAFVKFFQDNAGLITGMASAVLLIGVLLCVVGVFSIGIGMIATGAASLYGVVSLNWNAISDAITKFFQDNAGLVTGLSMGVLLIGVLLCCVGVFPIGIAMIAAGAAGTFAAISLNWNAITDKLKEVWQNVKNWWNNNVAYIFTGTFWAGLGKGAINGLVGVFEGGINGIISGFEAMINWVIGGFNKISVTMPDWGILGDLAGKSFGVNISPVNFGRVSIPRLAQGMVIPANREFLAMLGDQKNGVNIETPLSTMVDAFNRTLDGRGNSGSQPIHIHLSLDGREIYEVVVEQNKKNTRMTGVNEFAY